MNISSKKVVLICGVVVTLLALVAYPKTLSFILASVSMALYIIASMPLITWFAGARLYEYADKNRLNALSRVLIVIAVILSVGVVHSVLLAPTYNAILEYVTGGNVYFLTGSWAESVGWYANFAVATVVQCGYWIARSSSDD